MLRYPDKLIEITDAVVKAVNIPVTVKTRLGWDESISHSWKNKTTTL